MLNKHKKEAIYEYFILQILDKFHKKKKKQTIAFINSDFVTFLFIIYH